MTCKICGEAITIKTESVDVDGQAIEGKEYEKGRNVECPDYEKLTW